MQHALPFNRYDNRPSREEDKRRICELEADAIESRNVAARAREEMAFFKRELLNREENYNKKFNANPVVGVMQVSHNSAGLGYMGSVRFIPSMLRRALYNFTL